jgi:5'-3' exonuclease
MGIPRLFFWLQANFPQCLLKLKQDQTFQDLGIEVDCYALDNNAIIHPVCQKAYGYGNKEGKSLLHKHNPRKPPSPHQKQIFSRLCVKTDELRRIVNPLKRFIFATDGVAGVSKQSQQRQRRFISSKSRDPSQEFDSNSITTGSEFMNNLSKYVHVNIQRQLSSNQEWKHLEVVFSNEKVPGEGEHKIIDMMKRNKSETFCVDSPDADLLMLTLSLDNPQIYIIRENIYSHIDCKYFVVDVNIFRSVIVDKFRWGSSEKKFTSTQLIYDFILMGFMLGNDFLPHIPSLEISHEGLDILMDIYPRVASRHGHLVYRNKSGELSLNNESLHHLFFALASNEPERLLKKSQDKTLDFPDILLLECVKEIDSHTNRLDFELFRDEFYKRKLDDKNPKDVCEEYFKGMLFVIRYYIDGIPDWFYSYPFHNSPLFCDMAISIKDFNGEMKFEKHSPLSSFEQLLAVMPPGSVNLLPECLRDLVVNETSPISDFYPRNFKIDLDGKKKEWEGTAILPHLDIQRLREVFSSREQALTEEERKRNRPGKTMSYVCNEDEVVMRFI